MSGGPPKLIHVFSTFGAGGPQVRAVQLMKQLGPGYRHLVMAMDRRTEASAQLPDGVAVELVERPPTRGFPATVRAQRRWLRGQRPDLVLTYNWGAIESVVAARLLRLPLVHHEDGFGPEEATRRFRRRNWLRRLLLPSIPVVVPSSVLAGIARREWHLGERLHFLVNGTDLERFRPVPGAPRDELMVGTVGGLRLEKDHRTLLDAFAAVTRSPAGARARLRIVGDGALRAGLQAHAEALGIAPKVEFVGAVVDTAPEYRRLDVFVLSSRTEQMPIALLEAMASGCAVAATDVGDVRAMLPDCQRRYVVPKEDPESLAAALRTLLGDAEQRQRLGQENRRRAERDYESTRCLERFAALYRAAMAR